MVLDQVAYEHEARGVKSLKILTLSRCSEGTIDEEPVKNTNRAVCNAFKSELNFSQNQGSIYHGSKLVLDQEPYELVDRDVSSLKI